MHSFFVNRPLPISTIEYFCNPFSKAFRPIVVMFLSPNKTDLAISNDTSANIAKQAVPQ